MDTEHLMDDKAETDEQPRRNPTIQALDARLSVWGQAARDAVGRRAEALAEGASLYVERVGRNAEILPAIPLDASMALLSTDVDILVPLASNLIPAAVRTSARLLWVDPEKLKRHILAALEPSVETSRAEIRRRQALYRRRARLWADEPARMAKLREEVESLRVPRCADRSPETIAKALLLRHREEAKLGAEPPTPPAARAKLRVRAGSIARWVDQLDQTLAAR